MKITISSIIFVLQSCFLFSQTQKAGLPNYLPTPSNNLSHIWIDTLGTTTSVGKGVYIYQSPKWQYQGKVIKPTSPTDTVYSSYIFTSTGWQNIQITVSYQKAEWFNTANNQYYDYNPTSGTWISRNSFYVNLLPLDNNWTGLNVWDKKGVFKDSLDVGNLLTAKKGINSDSTITSKGVKTSGDSLTAALKMDGARKGKRRVITDNDKLTGNDFLIEINMTAATADIIIDCPPINSETTEWFIDIMRTDNNSTYRAKFKRADGSFVSILNKSSGILRSNGVTWRFD
jgi:hypothetical protein